jgi:hypothetical protein
VYAPLLKQITPCPKKRSNALKTGLVSFQNSLRFLNPSIEISFFLVKTPCRFVPCAMRDALFNSKNIVTGNIGETKGAWRRNVSVIFLF